MLGGHAVGDVGDLLAAVGFSVCDVHTIGSHRRRTIASFAPPATHAPAAARCASRALLLLRYGPGFAHVCYRRARFARPFSLDLPRVHRTMWCTSVASPLARWICGGCSS